MYIVQVVHFVREGDIANPFLVTSDIVLAVDTARDLAQDPSKFGYRFLGGYYDGAIVYRITKGRKYRREFFDFNPFPDPRVVVVHFNKNGEETWPSDEFLKQMYLRKKKVKKRRRRKK